VNTMTDRLHLSEVRSTNTWLLEHCMQTDYPDLFTVYTFRQTAGRGQAGNSWESQPDCNLSFTTLFRIDNIGQATRLNLFVPLAIVNALDDYLPAEQLTVKWPNDVYWQNRKLAGILCENAIAGSHIRFSIAGVGLNTNQQRFLSDAPNPVSLRQITGREYELEPLLDRLLASFRRLRPLLDDPTALKDAYMARLFRRHGFHPYVEREVSTAPTALATATDAAFLAEIADIDEFGRLILRLPSGEQRTYHFKQIRFVL